MWKPHNPMISIESYPIKSLKSHDFYWFLIHFQPQVPFVVSISILPPGETNDCRKKLHSMRRAVLGWAATGLWFKLAIWPRQFYGTFHCHGATPIAGWLLLGKIPFKLGWFAGTPISGNAHMCIVPGTKKKTKNLLIHGKKGDVQFFFGVKYCLYPQWPQNIVKSKKHCSNIRRTYVLSSTCVEKKNGKTFENVATLTRVAPDSQSPNDKRTWSRPWQKMGSWLPRCIIYIYIYTYTHPWKEYIL